VTTCTSTSTLISDPESGSDATGTGLLAGSGNANAIDLAEESIPDRPGGWMGGF
jgi:hypothetical protein